VQYCQQYGGTVSFKTPKSFVAMHASARELSIRSACSAS